jgi:hypothetical protein
MPEGVRHVSITLSAEARRRAKDARRLVEVETYLREVDRIVNAEIDRCMVDLLAFGACTIPHDRLD